MMVSYLDIFLGILFNRWFKRKHHRLDIAVIIKLGLLPEVVGEPDNLLFSCLRVLVQHGVEDDVLEVLIFFIMEDAVELVVDDPSLALKFVVDLRIELVGEEEYMLPLDELFN